MSHPAVPGAATLLQSSKQLAWSRQLTLHGGFVHLNAHLLPLHELVGAPCGLFALSAVQVEPRLQLTLQASGPH